MIKTAHATDSQLFAILSTNEWHECKAQVKQLYNRIKHTLTEEDQAELLVNIFYSTHIDDDITEYWNYMNS